MLRKLIYLLVNTQMFSLLQIYTAAASSFKLIWRLPPLKNFVLTAKAAIPAVASPKKTANPTALDFLVEGLYPTS
jgi:hypothetical protein